MKRSTLTSFAAGAVVALVLGGGTAVAATGGTFILGHSNSASATTTLTDTRGTALSLKSKAGTPALKVGNTVKVPSLNADLLDGLSSGSFARTTGKTGSFDVQGDLVDFDDPADGVNDGIVATATCPAGTQMTGGGVADLTDTGQIVESAPSFDVPESWEIVVAIDAQNETSNRAFASVVCYNPTGPIAGSYGFAPQQRTADPLSQLSPAHVAQLRTKLASRH